MGPPLQDLVLEMLQRVLPPLVEHGEVLLANRGSRLVGYGGQEDSVHLVTYVGDWLWLGHSGDFLEERLSEVALLVRLVHQERVRFEVVNWLIDLVDS